jgi:hypothetical protein
MQTADMAKALPAPALKRANPVSDFEDLSGCYRLEEINQQRRLTDTTKLRRMSPAVEAIVGKVAGARAGARAPAAVSAAPAAPAAPGAEYVAPQPPAMMRLDTARNGPGYAVRSARSDSVIGWWNRIDGDSVRVDLRAAGRFNFAAKDRVTCPQ